MKRTIGIVLAGVLGLGTLAAVAAEATGGGFVGGSYGRDGMGWRAMQKEMRAERFAERLKLTPEQKQKLETIHSRQKERRESRREQARLERQALEAELRKDSPNRAEIQRLMTAMQQRHAQQMQERVEAQLEFNQSLTPEQRAELNKMAAEREQKRLEMKQRREQRKLEREKQKESQTPQQ